MIGALALVAGLAAAPAFGSPEELRDWLTYYYLKPSPERTLASIPLMDEQLHKATGRSLADQVARAGMRTFYAKVFAQNDAVVDDLGRRLRSFSKNQQAFLREALRRCGTAACQHVLSPTGGAVGGPVEPTAVDDLWAAFAATGDERYVRSVIAGVLAGSIETRSLESNAYQHARALAVCEAVAGESEGMHKSLLEAIVARARERRALNPPEEPE